MKAQLQRSNDRIVFGVAGGIADFLNVDPTLVRLLFLVLLFTIDRFFLFYILLAFIIPVAKHYQQAS